jgi:hypothetical protein
MTGPEHYRRAGHLVASVTENITRGQNEIVACRLAYARVRFWERNGSSQPPASTVRCGQRRHTQRIDQRLYPSSGPLFERSRGSGRRGRRFKSGHPDPSHRPLPTAGCGL